jgi:hypothetical protein
LTIEVLCVFWIKRLCCLHTLQIFLPKQWGLFTLWWFEAQKFYILMQLKLSSFPHCMCILLSSLFRSKIYFSFKNESLLLTFRLLNYLLFYFFPVSYWIYFLLLFLVGLRFEFRALCLQRRLSTTWTTPPVRFGDTLMNCLSGLASNCDPSDFSLLSS